jgi:hypothetical protein
MKKIPMFLLMIAPCAFAWLFFHSGPSAALILSYLSILLLNILYPLFLPRLNFSGQRLLFWDMLLKLWNIPLYLAIFLFAFFGMVLAIPAIPFLFLFDYTLLLATSAYGIVGLVKSRQSGLLSTKAAILHIFLHFLFCFDVFSAIYCFIKARRKSA